MVSLTDSIGRGLRAEKINKALETAVPQKIEKYRQV